MQVPGAGTMLLSTLPVSVRSVMSNFSGQLLVLLAAQPINAQPLCKACNSRGRVPHTFQAQGIIF